MLARPDVEGALRECRLWRTASDAAIDDLVGRAVVEDVARGTALVTEGEAASRFGVVVNGRVRVFHLGADGRTVVLETAGRGEAFAAVAALAGGRYPAHADSATSATVAWIQREAVFDLLSVEPDIMQTLVADLAQRVVGLTAIVQTLSLDVPGRLARYLFERSLAAGEATSEGLRVPLGITKTELAASLGTVPETLSRAFARLRDEGVLVVRASDVIVLDVGALARMSSGYER